MGIESDQKPGDALCFTPATEAERRGFGADVSPLAHFMTYGPDARPMPGDEAAQQAQRRTALARLIEGAF